MWEITQRYRVRVHPCYYLGWSRCSCKFCIFGNKHQFASVFQISPCQMKRIINLEKEFQCTIKHNVDLPTLIAQGTPYKTITEELKKLAISYDYTLPVFFSQSEE